MPRPDVIWKEICERALERYPDYYVRNCVTRMPSCEYTFRHGISCTLCGKLIEGTFQQVELAKDNNEKRVVLTACWDRDACDARAFQKSVGTNP